MLEKCISCIRISKFFSGGGPRHPAWTSQLRCSLGQAPPDMVPSALQAKNSSYAPEERQAKLRMLRGLAKIFLSVTASSVQSARIFSAAGQIISARRSCLKPSNVDKLVFNNN